MAFAFLAMVKHVRKEESTAKTSWSLPFQIPEEMNMFLKLQNNKIMKLWTSDCCFVCCCASTIQWSPKLLNKAGVMLHYANWHCLKEHGIFFLSEMKCFSTYSFLNPHQIYRRKKKLSRVMRKIHQAGTYWKCVFKTMHAHLSCYAYLQHLCNNLYNIRK